MFKIKTIFNLVLLILLSQFLFSCNENYEYFNTSKDAIKDIKLRFPTLVYSSNKNIKEVSMRKISIENDSIEINLIEFAGDEDQNKILVFKNKKNHYYAIPLFSSIHRDYWDFKNDSILKQIPKVNSTFKKEFLNMIKILNFKKMNFWKIYNETFLNVLQWDFIVSKNELRKHYKIINMNNNSLIENEDSGKSLKRILRNISDLEKSFKNNETYLIYGGGMIIEFSNIDNYNFKNNDLNIKCYRQDMNLKSMNL